jgi:cytochrome c553
MARPRAGLTRLLGALLAGVAALAVGAMIFAWSGLYSVAASRGHWAVVEWFLRFGMRNSVETHALPIAPPDDLADVNLVRLGAGHFHSGCAYCHGAPGQAVNPIAQHMLPEPPSLSQAATEWKPRELFWIVKHGIKYTGMPGWAARERDDEVWAAVAFLRQLPAMTTEQYRNLALGDLNLRPQAGRELAMTESNPQAIGACARCHGAEGSGPTSNLVPLLHGQSADYLTLALRNYAKGSRASGIMSPIASDLDQEDLRKLADYYARLRMPQPERGATGDAAAKERGRKLALEGDPAVGIPGCEACHGASALATYPRLAGQHAAYMAGQLRLWRAGGRRNNDSEVIMAPIAERLNDQQIADVSAYYAGLSETDAGARGRR